MNGRYLAALCALAETGSIAAAGRRLGLASTTIAEQIHALETELKVDLTIRQGRKLALSDAGRAALSYAQDIVVKMRHMRQAAQGGSLRGELRVGSISTALTSFIPFAMRDMATRYPDIEIKISPATSSAIFDKLEREELDCAITAYPPFKLPKSFTWFPIRKEPLVLLSPLEYGKESANTLLRTAPFIRMDRGTWTGQMISSFLRDERIQPRELFEMSAHHTIVVLVSLGLGVTVLPDSDFFPATEKAIRKLKIGDERHVRRVGLLGTGKAPQQLTKAFAEVLAAQIGRWHRASRESLNVRTTRHTC